MRPSSLRTRIFLDGGDPAETREVAGLLGFLDGQTTNPTLIAQSPAAQERTARGERFGRDEVYDLYRGVVREISALVPAGPVSIEVYADLRTTADAMIAQGREMNGWIPNAQVKLPVTPAGLEAAERLSAEGIRLNLTLCFSEDQAAAVYAATAGAKKGDVFLSPFVGRLDDAGENGMSLIGNILRLYREGDGHVEVLTASVRSVGHLLEAVRMGSDIVTAPAAVLREWAARGMPVPDGAFRYDAGGRPAIPYRGGGLARPWRDIDLAHPLTTKGVERFAADWNAIVA